MNKYTLTYIFTALILLTGCNQELKKVQLEIVDNFRHYYPITQGKIRDLQFEIADTCDDPVFIDEIQASCGIISEQELPVTVLPHSSTILRFRYDSNKNIGHVSHYINLYGNFEDSIYRTIYFDMHVVLPADYYHDYEQRYFENAEKGLSITEIIDGDASSRGYYLGDYNQDFTDAQQRTGVIEEEAMKIMEER